MRSSAPPTSATSWTARSGSFDVGTIDFKISPERQDALVEQGIPGTENYFNWFEDPAETPVNRFPDPDETPATRIAE